MPYACREVATTAYKSDIYLAGGAISSSLQTTKNLYKFDTKTETYTKLTDLPYAAYGMGLAAYKDCLYIFGGRDTSGVYNYAYKYNINTNEYTQLTNMPYKAGQMGCTIVGEDVYLYGGTIGNTRTNASYKYNIPTDTYTQIANYPSTLNTPGICSIGNNIYIMAGMGSGAHATSYKYDTLKNTYTQLSDTSYVGYSVGCAAYNNYIYVYGGEYSSSAHKHCIVYDIYNDSYTTLAEMPTGKGRLLTNNTIVNNKFYAFGGTFGSSSTAVTDNVYVGVIDSTLENYIEDSKAICIYSRQQGIETRVANNISSVVDGVSYLDDGFSNEALTVYVGNGSEWINIQ